ncbi:MAG TPA: hypothetical protein PK350_10980 [Deltaproteobacteria bacterium]|nr:hypothetical protein [Deltaproteobacteria bacterium]HPI93648.1 hypothetical protein [Deltaproteobacteria bacterium]HPR54568.1 hypothetical protein [Deltaproteobacteria bacterium]
MGKIMSSILVVLVVIGFTMTTFAAEAGEGKSKPSQEQQVTSTETSAGIMGNIVSINKAKNEVVIKDNETKTNKVVIVEAKEIGKFKKGDFVKVVLAPGSDNKAGYIGKVVVDAGKREEKSN